MTPRGVALCRFSNEARTVEAILVRFAYEWAPALRRYPIVFDAAEEQVAMEGGDIMVANERTIFIGVGNRSQEAAAQRLARRLQLDVVAVQLPAGPKTQVHSVFLHLDTVCTFVDRKTALTLPYFFEEAHAGHDPLTRMLQGLAHHPKAVEGDIAKLTTPLKELGRVRRYLAGSGELDNTITGLKLVDYLRREGYRIVFAGGPPPATEIERYVAEVVLAELRRQAANVVALAPGHVAAYAGNPATERALRDAGIRVDTFDGRELRRQNGGPHCLTQPLERM